MHICTVTVDVYITILLIFSLTSPLISPLPLHTLISLYLPFPNLFNVKKKMKIQSPTTTSTTQTPPTPPQSSTSNLHHHNPLQRLKIQAQNQPNHQKLISNSTQNQSKPIGKPIRKTQQGRQSSRRSTSKLSSLSSNPLPLSLPPFSLDLLASICESVWV